MIHAQPLDAVIRDMKIDIVTLCHRCGESGAHLGGCMSLVEILAVLYTKILHIDLDHQCADKVILSKAHASIAQYAAMKQAGLISESDFSLPMIGEDTFMFKHSRRNPARHIEMSGGSLGNGFPFAVGLAWSMLRQRTIGHVYTVIGDGECNEGTIWESAGIVGHLGLTNLTVIVDKNGLQLDGYTKDIQGVNDMADRWRAFGFDAIEINGHHIQEIEDAFNQRTTLPKAIIANTVKGHGISFAQDNVEWHQNFVTDALWKQAMDEIRKEYEQ